MPFTIFLQKQYNQIFEYLKTRENPLARFGFFNNSYINLKELYFSKIQENPLYFRKLLQSIKYNLTYKDSFFGEHFKYILTRIININDNKLPFYIK